MGWYEIGALLGAGGMGRKTGRTELVRMLQSADMTGVNTIAPPLVTRDGRTDAYSCMRLLGDLYVRTDSSDALRRNEARSLQGDRAAGRRRHGRGLPRARQQARPRRCGEGPPRTWRQMLPRSPASSGRRRPSPHSPTRTFFDPVSEKAGQPISRGICVPVREVQIPRRSTPRNDSEGPKKSAALSSGAKRTGAVAYRPTPGSSRGYLALWITMLPPPSAVVGSAPSSAPSWLS